MKRFLLLVTCLLVAGCFDTATPEKQCDPERRCTPESEPVCGDNGEWYECALVADCHEVAVALNETSCSEPPANNAVSNNNSCDTACAVEDCLNVVQTFDEDGCVTDCWCNDVVRCPQIEDTCLSEGFEDGCPICVDCLPIACPLDCVERCMPDGYAVCECDDPPECVPIDVEACTADPLCTRTRDDLGCDRCVCEDECPREFCTNSCPQGYLIVDGCQTCECHEPCNEGPECDLFCPTGNTTDPATGCSQSCNCVSDSCSPVVCALFCEYGFRLDGSGCEVCDCRGEPCLDNTDCSLDQTCLGAFGAIDESPEGECVPLQLCDAQGVCATGEHCGFYFRQDCCPPLTTCTDDLPSCPAVCLLELGALD